MTEPDFKRRVRAAMAEFEQLRTELSPGEFIGECVGFQLWLNWHIDSAQRKQHAEFNRMMARFQEPQTAD